MCRNARQPRRRPQLRRALALSCQSYYDTDALLHRAIECDLRRALSEGGLENHIGRDYTGAGGAVSAAQAALEVEEVLEALRRANAAAIEGGAAAEGSAAAAAAPSGTEAEVAAEKGRAAEEEARRAAAESLRLVNPHLRSR